MNKLLEWGLALVLGIAIGGFAMSKWQPCDCPDVLDLEDIKAGIVVPPCPPTTEIQPLRIEAPGKKQKNITYDIDYSPSFSGVIVKDSCF